MLGSSEREHHVCHPKLSNKASDRDENEFAGVGFQKEVFEVSQEIKFFNTRFATFLTEPKCVPQS